MLLLCTSCVGLGVLFLSDEMSVSAYTSALTVTLYVWIATCWSACVFQSDSGLRNSFILMLRLIHLPGHAGPPTKQYYL